MHTTLRRHQKTCLAEALESDRHVQVTKPLENLASLFLRGNPKRTMWDYTHRHLTFYIHRNPHMPILCTQYPLRDTCRHTHRHTWPPHLKHLTGAAPEHMVALVSLYLQQTVKKWNMQILRCYSQSAIKFLLVNSKIKDIRTKIFNCSSILLQYGHRRKIIFCVLSMLMFLIEWILKADESVSILFNFGFAYSWYQKIEKYR